MNGSVVELFELSCVLPVPPTAPCGRSACLYFIDIYSYPGSAGGRCLVVRRQSCVLGALRGVALRECACACVTVIDRTNGEMRFSRLT